MQSKLGLSRHACAPRGHMSQPMGMSQTHQCLSGGPRCPGVVNQVQPLESVRVLERQLRQLCYRKNPQI